MRLYWIPEHKIKATVPCLYKHEICPKLYIAGFSGQNFYTVNFTDSTISVMEHKKMSENEEIYTVYTAAGSDGRDKSHIYMGGHKNIYI